MIIADLFLFIKTINNNQKIKNYERALGKEKHLLKAIINQNQKYYITCNIPFSLASAPTPAIKL